MKVVSIFEKQLHDFRLSHAYLIIGSFKTEKIIEILEVKRPDLLEFKETPLKINAVRELIHWLALKPHSSPKKLAIIYKAETMTLDAANALLKTLEEPPKDSILILVVQSTEKILPTIISRCQLIRGEEVSQKEALTDYQTPDQLSKKNLKERFDYILRIYESENLKAFLNSWEEYFSHALSKGQDSRKILKKIFRTRDLLSTNTSVKLLLENLLMDF